MTNSKVGRSYKVCIRWALPNGKLIRTDYRVYTGSKFDLHEFQNNETNNEYWTLDNELVRVKKVHEEYKGRRATSHWLDTKMFNSDVERFKLL